MEKYLKRKERYADRINSVIEYATHQKCRSQQLLAYFGEPKASRCGVCDVCTKRNELGLSKYEFDLVLDEIKNGQYKNPISKIRVTSDKVERNELKSVIKELSSTIPFSALITPFQTAKSNKEVLTCLLALEAGIKTETNDVFTKFIEDSLKMKNAAIKVETVKYLLSNIELKAQFMNLLQSLKEEEQNPYVKGLLENSLS